MKKIVRFVKNENHQKLYYIKIMTHLSQIIDCEANIYKIANFHTQSGNME